MPDLDMPTDPHINRYCDEIEAECEALKAENARLRDLEEHLALAQFRNEALEGENAVFRKALKDISGTGDFDTVAEAVNAYRASARAALAGRDSE